jgi:hypothetical protein
LTLTVATPARSVTVSKTGFSDRKAASFVPEIDPALARLEAVGVEAHELRGHCPSGDVEHVHRLGHLILPSARA